ncbi:MAG: hypothetical protein HOO96_07530, partial [Polyangiaceae bacterium]|nr:hypothetical protein [Polyangiaceae bacterium]
MRPFRTAAVLVSLAAGFVACGSRGPLDDGPYGSLTDAASDADATTDGTTSTDAGPK